MERLSLTEDAEDVVVEVVVVVVENDVEVVVVERIAADLLEAVVVVVTVFVVLIECSGSSKSSLRYKLNASLPPQIWLELPEQGVLHPSTSCRALFFIELPQ
jgi:hypothetical protein